MSLVLIFVFCFCRTKEFVRVAIIDCSIPGSDLQARENFLYGMVLDANFGFVFVFVLADKGIL
jgi:hypothetical protein